MSGLKKSAAAYSSTAVTKDVILEAELVAFSQHLGRIDGVFLR
jgi:hypothetical protein